jgi:hypothetical protein
MPKVIADYSNTIIYKLCCNDPSITDIYIGHTTNFIQRKNRHKTCCNNNKFDTKVYNFIRNNGGWDNWSMIQLEEHNCKNKREAEAIEHKCIEKFSASLNFNKPYAMCKEEPEKYKQSWYEENKEQILDKVKIHYEEHKEEKLEYQKKYAEEHKEKIKEQQDIYREENKEKLASQKKIYREQHKTETAQANKEWREANKEKLKAQRAEVINCECGHQYTFGNKVRHLQTKIHIEYTDKLCGIVKPIITEDEQKIINEERKNKQMEKQKEYRKKNAQTIKEWKKLHYETNKQQITAQNMKYYYENQQKIKANTKKYQEENKEKIKLSNQKKYQENKEKILEKQKEIITCECGSIIRRAGKAEHCKSSKHIGYMLSITNSLSDYALANVNKTDNDFDFTDEF